MRKRPRNPYTGPLKEGDVTRQILDMLNYIPGVFAYKHWGGPMGRKGVHDIICCFQGKFVSIEVKSPSRRAEYSEDQKEFARLVNEAKGTAICVNNVDAVVERLALNCKILPLFSQQDRKNIFA